MSLLPKSQQAGTNDGYGSGYQNEKYARNGQPQKKSRKTLWIILAILAVLIVAGAVLGGVFGSRAANNNNSSSSASDNAGGGGNGSGGSKSGGQGNTSKGNNGVTATKGSGRDAVKPTATNQYGNPLYPSTTGTAKISAPAFTTNASLSCGSDPYSFGSATSFTVRNEHPLLFAPSYKWDCLPKLISADSYMSYWNTTIFANASIMYDMDPVPYNIDGGLTGSGVLDVAREVQLRIKHWGYAYQISKDTMWADRAWRELETAAGNTTQEFGEAGNNWNTGHFLDVGEFLTAFAIGYDWFYDAWTETQRNAIMWSILELGLKYGLASYNDDAGYGWFRTVRGNWNCVCNNGLILGALAIRNEDPTTMSQQILELAVPNQATMCGGAPYSDGTWAETPNYWYFGTSAHAQSALALLTATGSTHDLLTSNPGMKDSALFHMYVTGNQGLFSFGDAGPNKFVATANGIMFYASQFDEPMYALYQRDRGDAPEPMSMLYYDPQVTGQFWDGLALDHHFSNGSGSWASMRSSWTDDNGVYVAMKSSELMEHQTHGDLDGGDFVMDALGQRWAGELGNGDYLADGYFGGEGQDAVRWSYYRKNARGQNTLVFDNFPQQNVDGTPPTTFQTTGEQQDALVYSPANSSTAFFSTELTTFYNDTSSAKRAIRLLNGRRQVLIQDEVTSTVAAQWRMHTNATITLSSDSKTATLTQGGQELIATILSPTAGTFGTEDAVRASSDPATPASSPDQENPGVTVLTIDIAAGTNTVAVLFNPQWEGFGASSFVTPAMVAIDDWSLTSHE